MSSLITDSSLHKQSAMPKTTYRDSSIKMGMVRSQVETYRDEGIRYVVDILDDSRQYPVTCSIVTRFGGPFNYEEWSDLVWDLGGNNSTKDYSFRPGDVVLIAFINGVRTDGVILGCLKHPTRKARIPADKSIAYASEFNGIETIINKDGEYKQTFRGVPTNLLKLTGQVSGDKIPQPTYDEAIGTSYMTWTKDGSFTLSDNAKTDPQTIKVDKPGGKIVITSGKTIFTIDKATESYSITNKKTTINSVDEFNLTTKKTVIKSQELFDMEAADIKTKGKWAQTGNMKITGNIEQAGNTKIAGNLETSGITKLAGGSFPLIYDILLVIGSGNLGAPVISTVTMLKTTMTKAT